MTSAEREARRRLIVERELVRRDAEQAAARTRAREVADAGSDVGSAGLDAELDDLPFPLVG